MSKLVECVPNFSEGKRKEVIEAIVDQIRDKRGVWLLNYSRDEDHNRMVITFVGEPQPVKEAIFYAAKKAAELINMEEHKGAHPRIGATDVIPLIPLEGITMEECVKLARDLGEEVAEKLKIPVYLYEEAAIRPERKNLENIRRGGYETLKKEITKPERRPDFGKPSLHPTAGATVVGARMPLIAFNVNLGTTDIKIAKRIAKDIRASSGGLMHLKAIGVELKKEGMVQVSMNITDYKTTPLYRVVELIKTEAKHYGVSVRESEIIGLVPLDALIDASIFYLQLRDFSPDRILEKRIQETRE
ncbi:MAG: glutamate formimidoyltransferase [Candidatus Aerophobetes bacterium]|nr:glutamate formimidoyltransferase [Candidatus Aerophobetes bacterium]